MAERPDWRSLDVYQETITKDDFLGLLDRVYAPDGAWRGSIRIEGDRAMVETSTPGKFWTLRFASSRESAKPVTRFWRGKAELRATSSPKKPLQGVRIALDPGHIGGEWAKIEERWFKIGNSKPVTEGDMVLKVAQLAADQLRALGADVTFTRSKNQPATSLRPEKLRKAAVASLKEKDVAVTEAAVKHESELLFYRTAEIRQRARLVNSKLKPDLVLCLHFNAEPWGNEFNPTLTEKNHLHFLITGAFSTKELGFEDQRFNMLQKLLSRSYPEELAITEKMARSMAAGTGLPPYQYQSNNVVKLGKSPYIWGRNLLANRLFNCPVIYLEPYVMNNREVFERIQAGDYAGKRVVAGALRPSIYREYADSLVRGILAYYESNE